MAIILLIWVVLLYGAVGLGERFHAAIETIPVKWGLAYRISERLVGRLASIFGCVTPTAGISFVQRTSGRKNSRTAIPYRGVVPQYTSLWRFAGPAFGRIFLTLFAHNLLVRTSSDRDCSYLRLRIVANAPHRARQRVWMDGSSRLGNSKAGHWRAGRTF